MKRTTKIWLIAAALLIVVGGAIFCGTMLKTGWDFSAFGSPYYETNTASIDADFSNISISCSRIFGSYSIYTPVSAFVYCNLGASCLHACIMLAIIINKHPVSFIIYLWR